MAVYLGWRACHCGSVRFLTVALVALLTLAGTANAKVFDPTTFRLDNGMQVVVIENHRAPMVVHMVWYRVGSADETPGESGLAHFLEHLMFKGTKTIPPGAFSKIVARNGGQDNAFTSYDHTAYFQRVAKDKLELVMRMEADRMQNLTLQDKVVLPERDVVREERRTRTDNNPAAQLGEAANAALYLNHPYRRPVIGWAHEIEALTTEKAMAFYHRYYAPNNAILIVAGDTTPDEVRRLARKYYGPIPARDVPPRARPVEPEHRASVRVELRSPRVGQPGWSRTYLAPSYRAGKSEYAYPLQVLAELLGGGTTSRLYRSLVVDQGIAASAGAWYSADRYDLGEFTIHASPRPGHDIAAVEKAMEAELAKLLEKGVDADEVERAKTRMEAEAIFARDSLRAGPSIIGRALTAGRTVQDVEAWPDRVHAVTVDQVIKAARYVLDIRKSVTAVLLPEKTS